jgi:peptide/nickel transport system substrate-binding protein/oligopeptide transport system substrate-binding protein
MSFFLGATSFSPGSACVWRTSAWPGTGRRNLTIASLGLFTILALLVCGCEREGPPSQISEQPGGTLRVLQERANDLDPVMIDDAYEGTVANQIFEGLVKVSQNLAIVPSLADSWVVSEDGLRYRFHLQPGVRFHNGEPLSAQVVVASLTRVLQPNKPRECLAESYLSHIVGAAEFQAGRAETVPGLIAIDESTVEIVLDMPVSFFMAVLAMDQLRIVPTSHGWNALREQPIGTGPFRFASRTGGDITLVRNSDYWGRAALLDSLVLICADGVTRDQRVNLLETGQVDMAWIDPEDADRFGETSGFELIDAPELAVSFFGLNCQIPPLDDARVRRAIGHCIDHRDFADPEFGGVSIAAGILPPGMPGYLPEPRVLSYDPAAARALVREAGYNDAHPCPPIDLYVSSTGKLLRWIEERLRPDLERAGIPLRVHTVGWDEIDRRVSQHSAEMFSLAWIADIPDPDGFLFPLFHSDEPNNLSAFSDPEVDRMLEAARRMRPEATRLEQYRLIEKRVLDQAPLIPLYHDVVLYAYNSRVRGIEFGPYGISVLPFSLIWIGPPTGTGMAGGER